MPPVLERTLETALGGLARLAAEAEGFMAGAGVGEEARFKVQLGIEEILRNLAEHAAGSGLARVRLEVEADRVTLTIEDEGPPFDPRSAKPFDPAQPLADRTGRGMGLHLVRACMDEIHYEQLGQGNRLRLVVNTPAWSG
jgi:serine/threonine-protein kinase RsbW